MTTSCELAVQITQIIKSAKTIAVVGVSSNPDKASYRVANYLHDVGYAIIPVNPTLTEWKGLKAYASVKDVPGTIDIVDIFRRPEDVPAVVDDAIAKKAKCVWMQQGIVNNTAADKARAAGLKVVMDRCLLVEHKKI